MSTRWYPLYQRGNPQLRIFLPNFWMKLVNPKYPIPENIVEFTCSMEMTKIDIKNYLEKIYGIPVVKVDTRIALGEFYRPPNSYVRQEEDVKHAFITLPKGENFVYPDIFPTSEEETLKEEKKTFDDAKKDFKNFITKNKGRRDLPPWYSL